ncbi:MAG: MOSC domain-containing protein [Woeseiaceae bacterium]
MKLIEIWRYPVKSMLGEELQQANVTPNGLEGDRQWAVIDAKSRVSLSAKRYAELLRCRARTSDGNVIITLPNGDEYPVDSVEAWRELSEFLERDVEMCSADAAETIQHEFPTAVTEGGGDPFLYEPGTKAFVDCAPLHLLTTATLAELRRLQPSSVFHRARFRPNFLVETDESGFLENSWVNNDVTLGSLQCRVIDHTQRCVMTTRAQDDLPRDIEVIRTILKNNAGNVGVALRSSGTGSLSIGAEVSVQIKRTTSSMGDSA